MGLVQYTADRAIATVTLDSPHNRNALSAQLVTELTAHLEAAGADAGVRAVVLTHTGGTFCAGADLAAGGDPEEGLRSLVALLRLMSGLPKPVVTLIRGHVRAGGMGLVGASDIAIASAGSSFAFTEARLGLAPAVISPAVLPRMTPRAASRYFLTGEVFGAAEAVACGLVTVAGSDPELEQILDGIRACSPQGLRESKTLATGTLRRALDDGAEEMIALSARLFGTEEAAEGVLSFLQRRKPEWHI
jgi:enoyl-CoA hydratase